MEETSAPAQSSPVPASVPSPAVPPAPAAPTAPDTKPSPAQAQAQAEPQSKTQATIVPEVKPAVASAVVPTTPACKAAGAPAGAATGAGSTKSPEGSSKKRAGDSNGLLGGSAKRPRSEAGGAGGGPSGSPGAKSAKKVGVGGVKKSFIDDDDDGALDLAAIRDYEIERVGELGPSLTKRYESYRRADLRKDKIKKVCQAINPVLGKVSEPYIIAIKGLAKVFVGDVVETALEVRLALGDKGPLKPKHLREAFRRLRRDGGVPSQSSTRDLMY